MHLRQLLPDSGDVDVDDAARVDGESHDGRPFVVANMVTSVDGRAAVDGRSAPLSGDTDRALFHALRAQVDAVMAGPRTIAIERYGRVAKHSELRSERQARGLTPDPPFVLLSHRLDFPVDIPLFQNPDQRVILYTSSPEPLRPCAAPVELIRLPAGEFSARAALVHLHGHFGIGTLLCEGGPRLLAGLIAEGVVDELRITVAPLLAAGGEQTRLLEAADPLDPPHGLTLHSAYEHDSNLFLRYRPRAD